MQWDQYNMVKYNIDGLVEERRNSIINALELRLPCTLTWYCTQLNSNYTALDAKRRKYASALPSTFTSTSSPDNAQKPQIWPISAKGSP